MKTKFTPNLSQIKILITVYELNERNIYPVSEGIMVVLSGEEKSFEDISTFSTLTSYPQKKISRLLLLLFRNGYLKKKYDEKTDKMYIEMTEYGKAYVIKYLVKHKKPFKKVTKKKPLLFLEVRK